MNFKSTLALIGLKIAKVILTLVTLGIPKLLKLINDKIEAIESANNSIEE